MGIANSIVRTTRGIVASLGALALFGTVTVAQLKNSESQVVFPTHWTDLWPLLTSVDPWLLISAVLAALAAVAVVQQLFFAPRPVAAGDLAADGAQTRATVQATATEMKEEIRADKFAATIEAIRQGTASEEQVQGLRQALKDSTPDETAAATAEAFASTVADLAADPVLEARAAAIAELKGDPGEAATLLLAMVDADAANAARRARQAGDILAPFDVSRAISAYARAAELEPGDCWTWIALGRLHQRVGDLESARRAVERARQCATDDRDSSVADDTLGDIARAEGDLPAAREAYAAGLGIAKRLATRDPGNSEWQRDLSVSHNKLGDVAEQAGDGAEALRCYRASLPVAAGLAARWPTHPGFAQDLAIIRRRIAVVEARVGAEGQADEK